MFPNSKLRIEMRRMCEKTPNSFWVFGHKLFSSAVGMLHLTLPSVLLTGDEGEPVPQTAEGNISDTLGYSWMPSP